MIIVVPQCFNRVPKAFALIHFITDEIIFIYRTHCKINDVNDNKSLTRNPINSDNFYRLPIIRW